MSRRARSTTSTQTIRGNSSVTSRPSGVWRTATSIRLQISSSTAARTPSNSISFSARAPVRRHRDRCPRGRRRHARWPGRGDPHGRRHAAHARAGRLPGLRDGTGARRWSVQHPGLADRIRDRRLRPREAAVIDPVVTYSTSWAARRRARHWRRCRRRRQFRRDRNCRVPRPGREAQRRRRRSVLRHPGRCGPRLVADAAGNALRRQLVPYLVHSRVPLSDAEVTHLRQADAGDFGTYVTKLDPMGALLFSTSVGGDGHVSPGGIAIDEAGNMSSRPRPLPRLAADPASLGTPAASPRSSRPSPPLLALSLRGRLPLLRAPRYRRRPGRRRVRDGPCVRGNFPMTPA